MRFLYTPGLSFTAVGLDNPLSADVFIASVLRVAQGVTEGGVIERNFICPNTAQESTAIIARFSEINSNPFIMRLANLAGGSATWILQKKTSTSSHES
jgi:hypothetical protein